MTAKNVILMGDGTSHGGTVNEGFPDATLNGKPVAGVGHKGSCPKCKKTFVIVAGAANVTMFGREVALEGMKTSCGAVLIASQDMYKIEVDSGSAAGTGSANSIALSASADSLPTGQKARGADTAFDQYFHVISEITGKPLVGYPYEIELPDGSTVFGTTDEGGLTDKVAASNAGQAKLTVFDFEVSEND